MKESIHIIVGAAVILDEVVEGNFKLGDQGQQNPAEQRLYAQYLLHVRSF